MTKMMKKIDLIDLAKQISDNIEIVGLRPGEELYENLISERELRFTKVEQDFIFITKEENKDETTRMKEPLSSDNAEKMSSIELRDLIKYVENTMINTMTY